MGFKTGIWSSGKRAIGRAVNAVIPETPHIKEAARLDDLRGQMHKNMWQGADKFPKDFEARQGQINSIGDSIHALYGMDAAGYSTAKYKFPRNSHEQNVNSLIFKNNFKRK